MATMYNILLSIAKGFNDACKHRDLFLVLILLPLFVSSGWAACNSVEETWRSAICSYSPPLPSGIECPPAFPLYISYSANYCVSSKSENLGGRIYEICTMKCSGKTEADSLVCVLNPSALGCKLPDTTYTCQSVYTENNVIRSEIQMKVDGVPVGDPRYIIDGCTANGFCEGESKDGLDSCTYRIDPSICDPLIEGCNSNDGQFKLRGITADSVCFYTCSKKDTNDVVYLTYGNQGAKGDDLYYGLRTVYPMVTTLDTIPLEGYEFVDSLLSAEVDVALYRGVKSGKYVYWYSNSPAPEGVKSIVRIR